MEGNHVYGILIQIFLDQQWILMCFKRWKFYISVKKISICTKLRAGQITFSINTGKQPLIQRKIELKVNSVSSSWKAFSHTCEYLVFTLLHSKTHLHPSESLFTITMTKRKLNFSLSLFHCHQIFDVSSSLCKPWDHLMEWTNGGGGSRGLGQLPAPSTPCQVPHTWLHQCPAPRPCRTVRLSRAAGTANLPSVGSWALNISHFLLLLKAAGGKKQCWEWRF